MSTSLWVLVLLICISMFLFYRIPETFVNAEPEEYVTIIPNFLSRSECESLAAAGMKKGLEVSEVGGGTEEDPSKLDLDSRKSRQTWFVGGEHPVSDKLREKTKEFLSTRSPSVGKYSTEDVQVARYTKGGYYYHHFDGDDCTDNCPSNQRICTMLVYLKAPESGGETDFPTLKKSVTPEQGTAVFFWVSNPKTLKLYKQTLHAGMPVKRGVKMIATQWIRATN